MNPLTERQQREVEFYAEYAERQRVDAISLDPVQSDAMRPWNAYWAIYQYVRDLQASMPDSGDKPMRILDLGCGIGEAAIRFASIGYDVDAFDISPHNIAIARGLAAKHGLADRCTFDVMTAEDLQYDDDRFDFIVGVDILHHIEINRSVSEAWRVLKPGGFAIFKEHVEAPIIEPFRNSWLLQKIAPSEKSVDNHITHDEKKLTRDDVDYITSVFHTMDIRKFTMLGRFERLLPWNSTAWRSRLQKADYAMMKAAPFLKTFAGTAVLIGGKAPQTQAQHDRTGRESIRLGHTAVDHAAAA